MMQQGVVIVHRGGQLTDKHRRGREVDHARENRWIITYRFRCISLEPSFGCLYRSLHVCSVCVQSRRRQELRESACFQPGVPATNDLSSLTKRLFLAAGQKEGRELKMGVRGTEKKIPSGSFFLQATRHFFLLFPLAQQKVSNLLAYNMSRVGLVIG